MPGQVLPGRLPPCGQEGLRWAPAGDPARAPDAEAGDPLSGAAARLSQGDPRPSPQLPASSPTSARAARHRSLRLRIARPLCGSVLDHRARVALLVGRVQQLVRSPRAVPVPWLASAMAGQDRRRSPRPPPHGRAPLGAWRGGKSLGWLSPLVSGRGAAESALSPDSAQRPRRPHRSRWPRPVRGRRRDRSSAGCR